MNNLARHFLIAVTGTTMVLTGCSRADSDPAARDGQPPRPGSNPAPQGFFQNFRPNPLASTRFVSWDIVDQKQGGLVAASMTVPEGWRAQSRIEWDYTSHDNPARRYLRIEAPDGSAFVQGYPYEIFSWLSVRNTARVGSRSFGLINHPQITMAEAMRRYVIEPYRGRKHNLQFIGARTVPNLALRYLGQNVPGESISVRIRYEENGQMIEEDFYAMMGNTLTIPYHGPQGTTNEYHRGLWLVHSLGARAGTLDNVYPLLGFVAASTRPNPGWDQHKDRIAAAVLREYNRQLAAGYAAIAAAGRASRQISANNDAMIASMDSARAQANAASAARRASVAKTASADFDGYIRGTEKMNDPYLGTSEHSYTEKYHWTDGAGTYRHSNDPTFNPNVGGGGGPNWTLMTPAGK